MVSARLLAAGAPPRERLHALSLLGLLSDHADAGGRVRVPLDDIVGEFQLPRGRTEQALQALVRVQAVRRGADGLVLVGRQPVARGGLRLTAFLANVAAVLDDEQAEPAPASQPRSPVLLAGTRVPPGAPAGDVRRRSLRPRQPALAALALTGVVLLAALASSSDPPTRLRTVAGPRPTATYLSPPPQPGRPVPSDPSVSRPSPSQRPVAGDERVAGQNEPRSPARPGEATVSSGRAGAEPPSGDPGTEAAEADGAIGAPTPRAPAPPPHAVRGEAPASPDPASPDPASPDPAVRCPVRVPRIVVESAVVRPAGPDVVLGVPTTSVIEVRGALINPTRAAAVIRTFEVVLRSGDDTVVVPGPPEPLTVAPGQQQEWTVRTSSGAEPGSAPTVEDARITDWSWQEADLARSCPT